MARLRQSGNRPRRIIRNAAMSEIVDSVVIGAGVVGLAIGRALALSGRQVIVLEKNAHIGEETSSRNSEVIHAGIYYPAASLKARLSVAGRRQLYRYCEEKAIGYARCGKLIVALNDAQAPLLRTLSQKAETNGVEDMRWLGRSDIRDLEPELDAPAALWSPATGIVDGHAYMLALQGDIENAGGAIAVLSEFVGASISRDEVRIEVASDGDTMEIAARTVVNAAGLHASRVAARFEGVPDFEIPQTYYAKGSYFIYNGASPFQHLVYPLPVDGGLGIHATLDLAGRVRFGPDVEWTDAIDYSLDPERAALFYEAISSYWSGIGEGTLTPGYVGVRPKLTRPGEPPADFAILGPVGTGRAAVVHLFGIESPGLTASLAIGQHVEELLSAHAE
jgi:L-2-hydroxyglutarate oxidase LhgO